MPLGRQRTDGRRLRRGCETCTRRQAHQGLHRIGLGPGRVQEVIREPVVDLAQTGGVDALVVDLDGGGLAGKNPEPMSLGVGGDGHQDVDAVLLDQVGHVLVVQTADVAVVVELACQATGHLVGRAT